jgi:protein-disulfide isomerase
MIITRRQLGIGATAVVALGAVAAYGIFQDRGNVPLKPDDSRPISTLELDAKGPLDDIVVGSPTAPITIIEYASMSCPHCAHWAVTEFPKLKEKYIDTGKVRYIMREFPLNQSAAVASMAIRCAGPENYYPLVETLFAEQEKWLVQDDFFGHLYGIIKQAGISEQRFKECIADRELIAKLPETRDRAATKFRVQSTPTFFINGERHAGALPLADIEKYMEPYLKTAEK